MFPNRSIFVLATPDFVSGYTFHGDAELVFREFFGESNPFAGETVKRVMRDKTYPPSFIASNTLGR